MSLRSIALSSLFLASTGCASIIGLDGGDPLDDGGVAVDGIETDGGASGDSGTLFEDDAGQDGEAFTTPDAGAPRCLPTHAACSRDDECCSRSCGPGHAGCRDKND